MLNISVNRFATSSKQKKNLQKIMEDLDTTPHYTYKKLQFQPTDTQISERCYSIFPILYKATNHRRIPFNFQTKPGYRERNMRTSFQVLSKQSYSSTILWIFTALFYNYYRPNRHYSLASCLIIKECVSKTCLTHHLLTI